MSSLQSIDATGPFPFIAAQRGLPTAVLSTLLNDAAVALEHDSGTVRTCLAQAMALLQDSIAYVPAKQIPGKQAPGYRAPGAGDTTGPGSNRSGLAPWQIRSVKAHIDANLDKQLRLADLAAITRLSTSYFSIAFRRSFGVSLGRYLARQRVERAQTMMLSTGTSLSQIALACGFCDQAHLSRQFRQAVGSTPKAWRREHRIEPM
jgi:transcriptional regulator GlxA family with amidase domain